MSEIQSPNENAQTESGATPLSILIFGVASGDMRAVDAQLADDIEWDQMPYNQKVKGKKDVMKWLEAGSTSEKKPEIINNVLADKWGVFEYWNIGTATKELVDFGETQGCPFPKDPSSLIGQKYRAAQCFVYHLDDDGRIDLNEAVPRCGQRMGAVQVVNCCALT